VGEGQRLAYVKFTGIYRMSKVEHYTDADPMAKALIEVAADRIIWGSDYPHLSFGEHSSVALFNLIERWCENDQEKKLILVDNPSRLFGF
jgi:predicted TIM-barrel fold metal-dependent hydrolase